MANSVSRTPTFSTRKYLTHAERQRFLAAIAGLPETRRLFIITLAITGARVSELLALTPARIDLADAVLTLDTLKRRRAVLREVPVPRTLTRALAHAFDLKNRQRDDARRNTPIWTFSRVTAWRIIKQGMCAASLDGPRAAPRGLRHAFGVHALQSGVPITLVQRWLGHARLTTTAIYLDVERSETRRFAERLWRKAA